MATTMANVSSNAATAPTGNAIETAHEDMIVSPPKVPRGSCNVDRTFPGQHDAQLDYYGKRLATCSSDRTVRAFNVVDGKASGEGVVLKGSVPVSPPRLNQCETETLAKTYGTRLASRMGSSLIRNDSCVVFVRFKSLRMEGKGTGVCWRCCRVRCWKSRTRASGRMGEDQGACGTQC